MMGLQMRGRQMLDGREEMVRPRATMLDYLQSAPQASEPAQAAMPAAQQPGPMGPPVDPYAAIRTFPELVLNPGNTYVDDYGQSSSPDFYDVPFGFWDTLKPAGFESKYNAARMLDDGRMAVTLQQPGAHKYDTMTAIYGRDPKSGQWTLQNDPMQSKTRQVSTGESFVRDPLEQFGKDFVLPAVAMYTGANLLAPYAAQATAALEGGGSISGLSGMDLAADGGANALWQTGAQSVGTLPSTLPEVPPASPNIPPTGVEPVQMPALPEVAQVPPSGGIGNLPPTLPEVPASSPDIPAADTPAPVTPPSVPGSVPGPGPGPSTLPSWMPQWMRDDPALAQRVITGLGGLLGALEGGGSGGGGSSEPETFGPAKTWTSGLSMTSAPRPKRQALNYGSAPTSGLSMGAGRFTGG